MHKDEQIPLYSWNAKTNEFWLLGHKIDMVSSPDEFNKFIYNMQQENKQLQQRIDKGVEYINDLSLDFYDYECEQLIVGKYMINELLEILKGEK